MKFNEICRLCLCTERLFLPLYNSAGNLQEKIHTISSRVEVSLSDVFLLCFAGVCVVSLLNNNIWYQTFVADGICTCLKCITKYFIEF
jgi:hypothetical protein